MSCIAKETRSKMNKNDAVNEIATTPTRETEDENSQFFDLSKMMQHITMRL